MRNKINYLIQLFISFFLLIYLINCSSSALTLDNLINEVKTYTHVSDISYDKATNIVTVTFVNGYVATFGIQNKDMKSIFQENVIIVSDYNDISYIVKSLNKYQYF